MVAKNSASQPRRVPLNIFLLKETGRTGTDLFWSLDEFLSKPVGDSGRAQRIRVHEYALREGRAGTLYIRKPFSSKVPDWVPFVVPGLDDPASLNKLRNASYSALLIRTVGSRQFAIAFGHGRHMLDHAVVEFRFGLQVALNSISPQKIASIDKQTFDASPRITRTQAIRASEVSSYGVDTEQDMLRAIVGIAEKPHSELLGDVIAGMDSLKVNVRVDLDGLDKLLAYALERFNSKDYLMADDGRESAFAWVNNLQPVSDKSLVSELDRLLWKNFKEGNYSAMWLAIPDIVDWEQFNGFSYSAKELDAEFDHPQSLDISTFASTFRRDASIGTLKSRSIYLISAQNLPAKMYSAYKCIYAEIKHLASVFILNAGNWHRVDQSFEARINAFFVSMRRLNRSPPFVPYQHEDEEHYNKSVSAASPDYICLDRKLINFGGHHSKIEICDLFSRQTPTQRAALIHVKRGKASASLSHLFAQGLVSAELLVSEPKFVAQVDLQLSKKPGFLPFNGVLKAANYDLVYAIVDGLAGTSLDIPFFSKVNLESSCRRIQAYGFRVYLMHIPESATFVAKKLSAKAAKKAAAKTAAKKTAAKKTAAKKTAAKKTAAKKAAAKKTAAKKTAAKKTAAKKTAADAS